MARKTTAWILQAANRRDCAGENLNIANVVFWLVNTSSSTSNKTNHDM